MYSSALPAVFWLLFCAELIKELDDGILTISTRQKIHDREIKL